jgi:hypothetical protein
LRPRWPIVSFCTPEADEEHLVEAEGADLAEAPGVVVDERGAVGQQRVVRPVPVAAELVDDLAHAAGVLSDLLGRPARRSIGQRHAGRTDAPVLLGLGSHLTLGLGAAPAALSPDGPRLATEAGRVKELEDRSVLHLRDHAARRTPRPSAARLDVHEQRPIDLVDDAEHEHVR